jgi:hypothetical protein
MNDDNVFARSLKSLESSLGAFAAFVATLIVALPSLGWTAVEGDNECFVREGKRHIINDESTSRYERKLFLTPDEVARYVFLTNRYDDGDRSAAVYRARRTKGSLPGNYWLTVTEAADSVRDDHRNVRVRRFDAPLPASAANVVHDLWLRVLLQSRTGEDALPSAPTGVLSVVTANGSRLKAVTVSFKEKSPCLAVLSLGESLIKYAKLPAAKRPQAAKEIEKQARHLLRRKQ